MCGLKIVTEGNRILSIGPDKDDTFSRGYVCPKAKALKDLHEDPDRLRKPMRKTATATGWEEISWTQALDETARGIKKVQKEHGRDSVAVYLGNPTVHYNGLFLYFLMFIKASKV